MGYVILCNKFYRGNSSVTPISFITSDKLLSNIENCKYKFVCDCG